MGKTALKTKEKPELKIAHSMEEATRDPESGLDFNHPWYGEEVAPVDEIPEPSRWYCIAKQIGIKKKVGSIIVPDTVQSDQQWSHGLCLIIAVGPSVYKGSKFRDMELDPDIHGPKVRDIWRFQARAAPARFKLRGVEYIEIPDDALISRIKPEHLHKFSFTV